MYIYIYTHPYATYMHSIMKFERDGNGDNPSKNKLFFQLVSAVAVLQGYVNLYVYKIYKII